MWTKEEDALFKEAGRLIVNAEYQKGLEAATRLLQLVNQPAKWAYVAGCKYAVALRHLGRQAEAQALFKQAYQHALADCEPVIAAYVQVDWSSEAEPCEAIPMVKAAIEVCEKAAGTPDPERNLAADIAYFNIILACHAARATYADMRAAALLILTGARRTLKQYAYGGYLRYQEAYLVALMHEQRLLGRPTRRTLTRWTEVNAQIAIEVLRQRRVGAAILLMLSPARRQRVNAS